MNSINKYIFLSILIFYPFCAELFAQTGMASTIIPKEQIIVGKQFTVNYSFIADIFGFEGQEQFKGKHIGVVELDYNRELFSDVAGNEWGYRIKYILRDDQNNQIGQEEELTVQTFENEIIYEDQKTVELGHNDDLIKIEITDVLVSTDNWVNSSNVLLSIIKSTPKDIRLNITIEEIKYDYLDPFEAIDQSEIKIQGKADQSLEISWPHIDGAEYYELEWVHQSQFEIQNQNLNDLFVDEAVRIETATPVFEIPYTYHRGTLWFRVRAVGRFIRNIDPIAVYRKKNSTWSSAASFNISTGYENDQHWQATTSFAEEGKYKKVIGYYDDEMKPRQTATHISTDETVLRSTTHYDYEGRAVMQVLPAPDIASFSFQFNPQFNQVNQSNVDTYSPAPLTGPGTSSFYSGDLLTSGFDKGVHNEYVPDAEGYPYVMTKFNNDGTGRIVAQSGVGPTFKIGSGHETKYYYDDPSSVQLRRLFGTNVGNVKYYKRNLVQDPNGQLSVSYLDMYGNIVATALAGSSPDNVTTLDSEADGTTEITENLLESNFISEDGRSSISVSTVMNEMVGTQHQFEYELNGGIINLDSLCFNCKYLFDFTIIDPCGEVVFVQADTLMGDDICTDTLTKTFTTTLTFDQIGLYTVQKQVRSIERTSDEWLEYLVENNLMPDSSYFADLFLSQIDTTECVKTCDQYCRDIILSQYNNLTEEQLLDSIEKCVELNCFDTLLNEGVIASCEGLKIQLIDQLSEGGCYYDIWESSGALSGLTFIVEGEEIDGPDHFEVLRNSTLAWEPSWDDTLALIHPEYCVYEFCLTNTESRKFDFQLLQENKWSDVENEENYLVNEDPFFTTTPGNQFAGQMIDFIMHFGAGDDQCDSAGMNPNFGLVDLIECKFADSSDVFKWEFYQSIYSGQKMKFLAEAEEAYCGGLSNDPNCTVAVYQHPFITEELDIDSLLEWSNNQMDTLCHDVCTGQANYLADILMPDCDEGADRNALVNLLMAHCTSQCGYKNPFGILLWEDSATTTFIAIESWVNSLACDTMRFDSLVMYMDSIYMGVGYPQDAGISYIDTICMDEADSIFMFYQHDSIYQASLDSTVTDSILLSGQEHVLDTGLYYFVGYDPDCDVALGSLDSANQAGQFSFYDSTGIWEPGVNLGMNPVLYDFMEPGCYAFEFFAPTPAGACSDASEILIYVPGCENEFELIADSLDECTAFASLDTIQLDGVIDTIIFEVSVDGADFVPYVEDNLLSGGTNYIFSAEIIFASCCDTITLLDTIGCCDLDVGIDGDFIGCGNVPEVIATKFIEFYPSVLEDTTKSYFWDFGESAEPSTRIGYGPHEIAFFIDSVTGAGIRSIQLVVFDGYCKDTVMKEIFISVCPGAISGFVTDTFGNGIKSATIRLYQDENQDGIADNFNSIANSSSMQNGSYFLLGSTTTPGHYVIGLHSYPVIYESFMDIDYDNNIENPLDAVQNTISDDDFIPVTVYPTVTDELNNFQLVDISGSISGRVYDNLDTILAFNPQIDTVISNVLIKLYYDFNDDGFPETEFCCIDSAFSDENGYIFMDSLPPYNYVLSPNSVNGYTIDHDQDFSEDFDYNINSNLADGFIPCTIDSNEIDSSNTFIFKEASLDLNSNDNSDIVNRNDESINSNNYIEKTSVSLLPNPTRSKFTLIFEHEYRKGKPYTVDIYDSSGQRVKSKKYLTRARGKERLLFNTRKLAAGVYVVVLSISDGVHSLQLVVIK